MGAAVSKADTHYLQYDIQWASLALLYYDYALTFTREVRYIWRAKFTLSTLLYILCRYALLANVLYLLAISSKLKFGCDHWYMFVAALSVFGRAAIIVTLLARTYAVCSRNRVILGLLSCIGIACVVTDALHIPGEKCVNSVQAPLPNLLRALLTIVLETSVAIITTVRTMQALKIGGPWHTQKNRLVFVVFEEGILYFCFISTLTITSVILDLRAPAGYLQRLLDALTLPLSGFMTARFILHLRAWRDEQMKTGVTISNSKHPSGLSSFLRSKRKSSIGTVQEQPNPNRLSQTSNFNRSRCSSPDRHEYGNRLSIVKLDISEFGDDPVERARRRTEPSSTELEVRVDRDTTVLEIGNGTSDDPREIKIDSAELGPQVARTIGFSDASASHLRGGQVGNGERFSSSRWYDQESDGSLTPISIRDEEAQGRSEFAQGVLHTLPRYPADSP